MLIKSQQNPEEIPYITYEQMNTIDAFQKVWIRMAAWNRSYIRALIYNTPNLKLTKQNMRETPSELGDLFSVFFGTLNGKRLEDLFFQFNEIMMKVTEALKYGDTITATEKIIEWYQSADEIAAFLAKLNIYWDYDQWVYLLYQYIKYKTDEINAVLMNDYDAEMATYNMTETFNFLISNYMARGVFSSQNFR